MGPGRRPNALERKTAEVEGEDKPSLDDLLATEKPKPEWPW
jgi:hypothetical protein